jgi:hypothetical protein
LQKRKSLARSKIILFKISNSRGTLSTEHYATSISDDNKNNHNKAIVVFITGTVEHPLKRQVTTQEGEHSSNRKTRIKGEKPAKWKTWAIMGR